MRPENSQGGTYRTLLIVKVTCTDGGIVRPDGVPKPGGNVKTRSNTWRSEDGPSNTAFAKFLAYSNPDAASSGSAAVVIPLGPTYHQIRDMVSPYNYGLGIKINTMVIRFPPWNVQLFTRAPGTVYL